MVSAISTSVVPKITVIVGGSFGGGHYAMCGKAYDPRFLFAWPTARYAVMSGASAANTLAEVRAKQMERGGKVLSDLEKKALYDEIKDTYDAQADPRYEAARLWIDAIIDPAQTREALITALEACALNPDVPKFNPESCRPKLKTSQRDPARCANCDNKSSALCRKWTTVVTSGLYDLLFSATS
jgi:3-methylcrotonyl-CoA carboxylase beta subunit